MAIDTAFPADRRLPQVVSEFDLFGKSRAQQPVERIVAVVATKTSAGTATADVPVECFSDGDGDTKFGTGSEASLICRRIRSQWRLLAALSPSRGAAGRIVVCPIVENAGGTAATGTLTVTGTATANGTLILRIGGRFVQVGISSGDLQNSVATKINTAIADAGVRLPVTAGVATNVVTLTYRHKGIQGNRVSIAVWQAVAGTTVTPSGALMTTGAGAPAITNALNALLAKRYLTIAQPWDTATEVTAFKTHLDAAWGPSMHRQRFIEIGSRDSVANINTLATGANDYRISVHAFTNTYGLPLDISAVMAAVFTARDRPNYNWDNIVLDLDEAPEADVYEETESESLLASGAGPIRVDEQGKVRLARFVTTQTTNGGVRVEELLDRAHPYTIARCAWDIRDLFEKMKEGASVDDAFLRGLRTAGFRYLKQRERDGWLQNVDAHATELMVDRHESVAGRVEVQVPESVVPGCHQVIGKHVMYIE
jgi:phage tail sheath gpL-like